jgi:GNAT superfamily N-acetyltransferase
MKLELIAYTSDQLESVRATLLDVYAEVYQDRLTEQFFSVREFDERLSSYAQAPTWRVVVAYQDGQPAGYVFGDALRPLGRWWQGCEPPLSDDFTRESGSRTVAVREIMVRRPWRGTGLSLDLHQAFLDQFDVERATLLVESSHDKVRRLYESWGYRWVASQPAVPDAPRMDALVLGLR